MKATIPSAFTLVLTGFFLFSPLADAVSATPPASKSTMQFRDKAVRSSKGRKSKVVPFKKGKRSSMALAFYSKVNKNRSKW